MRRLLTIAVVLMLSLALVQTGFCTTYTWDYTKFNTATATYYDLDDAQDYLGLTVTQKLTFNGTTTDSKAVIGICNGSSGTVYHVDIVFVKDKTFEVTVNMPAYIKIASGTWHVNQTTYIYIDSEGNLEVTAKKDDGTEITYIDDYNIGTFTIRAVSGSGANYSCTSGYISAITGYAGDPSNVLTEWMPTLLSFACVGIAIGFIKKFGKGF